MKKRWLFLILALCVLGGIILQLKRGVRFGSEALKEKEKQLTEKYGTDGELKNTAAQKALLDELEQYVAEHKQDYFIKSYEREPDLIHVRFWSGCSLILQPHVAGFD